MNESEYKLKQAREFENKGQDLHALQIYLALLNQEDSKRVATIRLAIIYEKMDRLDKVSDILNAFISEQPDDEEVHIFFAHYLIRHEEYEESLKVLSSVSSENNADVFYLAGLSNYKLDELRTAEINFKSFTQSAPGSELLPEANLYLAKIYLKKGEYDKALEYAKKSESFLSQNFNVHLLQAKILYKKEMYFHALESINLALNLNETDCSVYKWAGKVFMKLGEYKRAEFYLSEYVTLCDAEAEAFSLLGIAYKQNKKIKEALSCFKKSLKIDPENEKVKKEIESLKTN